MVSATRSLSSADNPKYDTARKGNRGTIKGIFRPKSAMPGMYGCIVGKAHLEIKQRSRKHSKRPLKRVYMDIMSSSIQSIEGYNYALAIVDDASMY